jgi:hypothetical protein
MSESLPNSFTCRDRQAAVRVLFLAAFLTGLLWAGGALPAQATTGGVPAAPDAVSDHGNQGNGNQGNGNQGNGSQGNGAGGVAEELPDAASDGGSSEAVPPPSNPAPEGAGQDGGANSTSGPYDPDPADPGASGVGQPSGNGKSTDNNGNRPCAGCVGKADYKNPPGQLPDGTDHNKGYECDENEGVGKMNPAHSGCAPGGAPPPTSVSTPAVTPPTPAAAPPPESPPPEAGAEEQGDVQGVEQGPELPEAPAAPPAVAAIPVTQVVTPAAEKLEKLPLTGGQPLFLGLLGLLTLVAGLGMARLLRTRSHA